MVRGWCKERTYKRAKVVMCAQAHVLIRQSTRQKKKKV